MRKRGFRLVQMWLPDTRSRAFAAECRRQSLLIARDPAERELMNELEATQDTQGWSA